MTPVRRKLQLISSLLLVALFGSGEWHFSLPREPVYSGKRLSVWVDEVRGLHQYAEMVHTNYPQIQAVRALGTNAIPWLVSEFKKPPPLRWRLNRLLEKQRIIKYRFAVPVEGDYQHVPQMRAVCGFWALGEMAEPAIPTLLGLVEKQHEFATVSLAAIGAPALPALEYCLTNIPPYAASNPPHAVIAGDTIGALFGALKAGRISESEAAFLLPKIRPWSQSTNGYAAYWANAVLKEDYKPRQFH